VQRLVQRIVLAPDDGSLGPLLRVADDRLPPGDGYGQHEHRAVDVVAVVLAGSLRHRWDGDVPLSAGDVAVLRAGTGLEHDEVAGPGGARVLQCYLRSRRPGRPATHEVHRAVAGWVDLGRADARLWLGSAGGEVPPGLRLAVSDAGVTVTDAPPAGCRLVVWELDRGRPGWATG
jgi:redox-sensitive bicupin YhaK (pirin superfamily)